MSNRTANKNNINLLPMQIYPITMRRNRHVILKHYLCTLPTQPSALLGTTMVAHSMYMYRVVYCGEFPFNFFCVDKSLGVEFPDASIFQNEEIMAQWNKICKYKVRITRI